MAHQHEAKPAARPTLVRRGVVLARANADVAASVATGFWGQATLVLSGPLAARILGPEDRGHLALLLILPLVLCQVGTLGLPLAATYYIAREPGHARPIMRQLLPWALAQAAIIAALTAGIAAAMTAGNERYLLSGSFVAAAFVPAWIALQYGLALLQGRHAFGLFNLARVLPATLYCLALVPVFFAEGERLVAVLAAWTLMHAVAAAIALAGGLASLPEARDGAPSRKELLRFGSRSMLGSISPVETFRIDQAVVGIFLSPVQLGIYVVALAFTNLPRFVAQGVGLVAYPRVAAARGEGRSVRRMAAGFIVATLALTVPAIVLLAVLAGFVVRLFFGPDFAAATTPARILLVGSLFFAARRILGDCARGAGFGASETVAELASWLCLVAGLAVLAPRFELNGVAAALAASAACSLVVLAVLLRWPRARLREQPERERELAEPAYALNPGESR